MRGRVAFASMVRHLVASILAPVFLAGVSVSATAAFPEDQLTAAQAAHLASGKPLVLEKEMPGEPWPEITIWQMVKYTPEELAGVFWDSELDAAYLPGCLSARILSRPDPSSQKAEFKLRMPFFLPDEVYVSDIKLIPGPPGTYRISWKVLESVYAKSCRGEILIQPHAGMTLIRYSNFMVPRSRIAVLLRGVGRERVIESFRAFLAQTGREVNGSPELLARQRKALRLAAGG